MLGREQAGSKVETIANLYAEPLARPSKFASGINDALADGTFIKHRQLDSHLEAQQSLIGMPQDARPHQQQGVGTAAKQPETCKETSMMQARTQVLPWGMKHHDGQGLAAFWAGNHAQACAQSSTNAS
jgi:hypothetical protein